MVAEKVRPGKPSTSEGGLRHQDHVKMNTRILGDAMAMQMRNDQKVVNDIRVKAQCEWDKLIIVVGQCPPLPKPILVKLASNQLL